MNRIYNRILAALSLLAAVAAPSCTDDRIWSDEEIGEGEAKISAAVTFKSFTPALNDSRSAAGSSLNSINNIYLFAYTEDGSELVASQLFDKTSLNIPKDPTNNQKPAGSTPEVENPTYTASFNFKLPYGKYKIYAVANIPENYIAYFQADQVPTESDLKNIYIPWDPANVANNGTMFGWFGTSDLKDMDISNSKGFVAPVVTINKTGVSLNAWLRRLASKITIGFDPSGLEDGVTIYIKSATIRHIADGCYVGKKNTPGADQLITDKDAAPLQIINYYSEGGENDHSKWLILQEGSTPDLDKPHDADAESLFFFENCQGDWAERGPSYNKQMNSTEMANNPYISTGGHPDGAPGYVDYKDKVPNGTFIEVEAYYSSVNEKKITSGPIRYRFMLGKNTTYNYDAERNYHYKLTLKFKNWANEPDWHIDYEEPHHGIHTPDEYFISYLYKQTMSMPVRISNADGIAKLRAEIVENNWAPYDPTQADEVPATPTYNMYNYDEFTWNRAAWAKFKDEYNDWNAYRGNANFLGFLALRATEHITIGDPTENYGPGAMDIIKNYYCDNQKWWAEYDLTKTATDVPINSNNENQGTYSVEKQGDDVIVQVPMWTRAKNMVQMTGFTGNNPYNAYRRKAVVRFYALDAAGNPVEFEDIQGNKFPYKDVPIFQVRRIVNPKAIWRAANNDDPFDIDLSILEVANTNDFTSLTSSVGPWRASIMTSGTSKAREAAWFTLTGNGKEVKTVSDENPENGNNYIEGSGGSTMKFTYKPNSTIGANEARYGIIKVEYMNYTCVHLILVRQGYDAKTPLGGKNWSCYSIYAMNGKNVNAVTPQKRSEAGNMKFVRTANPLSLGTMYKRANYEDGIMEINNKDYGLYYPIYDTPLQLIKLNDNGTLSKFTKKWDEMPAYGAMNYGGADNRKGAEYSWTTTFVDYKTNEQFSIPSWDDFTALAANEQAYGVIYGDAAIATAKTVGDAYTYFDGDNTDPRDITNKGTRGCLVYDPANGNQIFFPMGVEGQARRPCAMTQMSGSLFPTIPNSTTQHADKNQMVGTLCYSGVFGVLTGDGNMYRPIPYNLYRNAGAIYWYDAPKEGGDIVTNNWSYSWDMNYYSFDFSAYAAASLGNGVSGSANDGMRQASDALPIRLIYKN